MIRKKDLHTFYEVEDIMINSVNIGTTIISYEVRQYIDVRNLKESRAYQVLCTQRIVIPNGTEFSLMPQTDNAYNNYPVLLENKVSLNCGNAGLILQSYSPKTMNTAVVTAPLTRVTPTPPLHHSNIRLGHRPRNRILSAAPYPSALWARPRRAERPPISNTPRHADGAGQNPKARTREREATPALTTRSASRIGVRMPS